MPAADIAYVFAVVSCMLLLVVSLALYFVDRHVK